MKEGMQKSGCGPMSLATAMIVLIIACGISEDGYPEPFTEKEQEGIESPFRSVCCVSGFVYPSGFDWYEDLSEKDARCSLVVLADGVPKIKVPVGDGYEVSRDPDMHRVLDGNLYTFYSKDGKTVIRRNGAPLFRYDGDEILVDMIARGEDIYTLAHKRSGGGFSYRRNGNILLERFSGETFGRLWSDGDSLCFAFIQPVASASALENRYYVAYDSRAFHIQGPDRLERVWDIMSHKGAPCQLVSLKGIDDVMLVMETSNRRIEIPEGTVMLSCRMFPADSLIGVECLYEYPDGRRESGLWVNASEYMRFESGASIQALKYSGGKAFCILNPDDEGGIIYDGGDLVRMPPEYFCIGNRILTVHEGKSYVALSSRSGGFPVVWHEGQLDTLRINGCASSISFTDTYK